MSCSRSRTRLGVPVLTGTDVAGTLAREVALLAEHGLPPAAALAAATTTGYRFLGEPFDQPGRPATLVTYQHDPPEDLAVLFSPSAVVIDGVHPGPDQLRDRVGGDVGGDRPPAACTAAVIASTAPGE